MWMCPSKTCPHLKPSFTISCSVFRNQRWIHLNARSFHMQVNHSTIVSRWLSTRNIIHLAGNERIRANGLHIIFQDWILFNWLTWLCHVFNRARSYLRLRNKDYHWRRVFVFLSCCASGIPWYVYLTTVTLDWTENAKRPTAESFVLYFLFEICSLRSHAQTSQELYTFENISLTEFPS